MKSTLYACIVFIALLVAAPVSSSFAQLAVVSVSPVQNSTTAVLNEDIQVTFSTPVDGATLTAATFRVYGHQSGQLSGTYLTDPGGMTGIFRPNAPYKPGEIITVVLTSDIQALGGGALVDGFQWEFAARPQYGAGSFARPIGSTSPTESILYPTNTLRNPTSIYAGDLTGDAYPELAIASSASPSVTILVNSRSPFDMVDDLYDQELVVTLDDNAIDITGGDVNGDGQLDLVVSNYTVSSITLLLNQTNGGSVPNMQTQVISTTERPFSSVIGDFDGDGWQDIAVAGFGSDEVAIHLNAGNGSFPSFQTYAVGQAAADIVARDMTNDGFLDLVVASTGDQRLDILVNDRAGGFTLGRSIPLGFTPASISAFDFQETMNGAFGDTWADILVTAQDTALVTVLEHLGDPVLLDFIREDVAVPLASQAFGHVLADVDVLPDGLLDPDADLDVVLTQLSTNEIKLLLNQQAGLFLEAQNISGIDAGNTPYGITAADFERDGDVDVAFVSVTDSQVRVLFNDDSRISDFELIGDPPDFGDVYTCQDSTIIITLRNRRFEPVTVLDIEVDPSPPFLVDPIMPFEVGARESFSLEVTFDPDLPLLYNGLLTITSTDGFVNSVTEVDLVGQGIESDLSAVPDSVDFGQVPVGQIVQQPVDIQNDGNVSVFIDSLEVSDPINFSADFSGALGGITVAELGGVEVLSAGFMPQNIGPFSATVTLYTSDPCDSTLVVYLSGEGVSPQPDLIADSLWADVPTIVAGQTVQLTGQLDAGVIAPTVPTVARFENDEGDPPIDQQVQPAITGLSQYTATMQLDTPGLRTITFTVDAEDAVVEADELNNSISIQINVTPAPLPDLVASELLFDPDNAEVGQDVTFEGILAVANADVNIASSIRFEVDGVVHELDTALPIIADGEQRSFQTLPFVPDRTGVHLVTFTVDADNEIDELDETNNSLTVELDVSPGDLVVTPNPFTPNNDGTNEEVTIDYSRLVLSNPKLLIYSFEGRLIREITDNNGTSMAWDGRDDNDRTRDPGLYLFVLMEGNEVVDSGHVTLAR